MRSILVTLTTIIALVLVPSVAQAASKNSKQAGSETQVIALLNEIRADHHLSPLTASTQLRSAARAHSANMIAKRYFDHNGPDGQWDTRIARYIKSTLYGANIAWGQGAYGTPQGIVTQWMNSPTHRAIILTAGLKKVGIGLVTGTVDGAQGAVMATADFSA
jgi:uncharacterized protein YkwD